MKYKIVPAGSEKWIARDWEKWYKEFRQARNEVPNLLAKQLHKGLEFARRKITTEYLTGPRPEKLGVVTGRLRSSIHYKITTVNKRFIKGEIGTDVWYGKLHEEGGDFKMASGPLAGAVHNYPKRPFLKPGLEDSEDYISKLFQKFGMHLQRTG